jgi:RNA polymerase sigma-70 factor (ECF subfamily)
MADPKSSFHPVETSAFEHTNWFTVAQAGSVASPGNDAARSSIYQTYWYPIYFYIRRLGRSPEDAQDLTQEFFSRVFEKNYLQSADRAKGKFRSFLLIMLKHFLADEWDRANRQKRGGGVELLSLNEQDTEFRYRTEPADNCSPDKAFERSWATNLLDLVLKRLNDECNASGKSLIFQELKPFLTSEQEVTGADAARNLGITENHLKVTLHRLRQRCRELLRAEIARTASSLEQVEEEIQDLFAALRRD